MYRMALVNSLFLSSIDLIGKLMCILIYFEMKIKKKRIWQRSKKPFMRVFLIKLLSGKFRISKKKKLILVYRMMCDV